MNAILTADRDDTPDATQAGDALPRQGRWGVIWAGLRAAVGALMGLAPHVMHHIGLIAGAALLTGALGNSVLYAVGLLLSIPLLNRLRRRFNTWRAPILGVAAFTVLFWVSVFVIGPLINPSGAQGAPRPDIPATDSHATHHE